MDDEKEPGAAGADVEKINGKELTDIRLHRIHQIQDMLAQCMRHDLIQRKMSVEWGVTRRQIRNYIHDAYVLWERERAAIPVKTRIEQIRNTFEDLYQRALERGEYKVAAHAADRLARIEGAYAPERKEVAHVGMVGVAATDPETVRKRIAELAAKHGGGDDGGTVEVVGEVDGDDGGLPKTNH